MEVVSASNLGFLETEKTTFVMSHGLMRGQIRSHENGRLLIGSFMMAGL